MGLPLVCNEGLVVLSLQLLLKIDISASFSIWVMSLNRYKR